jgi:hypothetical protein
MLGTRENRFFALTGMGLSERFYNCQTNSKKLQTNQLKKKKCDIQSIETSGGCRHNLTYYVLNPFS